jgi:LuxR family maltose regulon positive regulatory protein
MSDILATKLYIPRPRSNLVLRSRLTERLLAGMDRKLTLVSAPAGFGKTTLLSEWIPQSKRCVTWVSLDEGDNDPTQFWVYFIAALQTIQRDLGKNALALLQLPQPPAIVSILTTLLNEIVSFPDSFAQVLDDYQLIHNQNIHDAVHFLIEHLPPQMHLVMTSRTDPQLPIARLRARGQLNEIRANDLRFTNEEIRVFLESAMNLRLSAEEIHALEARTEGWIAGLQIAALSMQGRDDISGFVQAFSGSHRHILGYLADEVINQQSKTTLTFLLQTSILDRLCGPLCDAVTEEAGGQAILENLEQANLFIVPLDDEGKWYRYHHLFAQALQTRLHHYQPSLLQELHRRASVWYEKNGSMAEAIRHAMAANDLDNATRLVEQSAWYLIGRGELTTLRAWLDNFPTDIVRARPRLSLAYAMIQSINNQLPALESHLQDAERVLENEAIEGDGPLLDDKDALKGQVASLRAHLALEQNDPQRSIEYCTQALTLIPKENVLLRGLTMFFLGNAQSSNNDIAAGIQTLKLGCQLGLDAGNPLLVLHILAVIANLEGAQGNLRQAAATYQQCIKLATEKRWEPHPHAFVAQIGFGEIFRERNDLDLAAQYLQKSLEMGKSLGLKSTEIRACMALASVRLAQRDPSNARALIQQATQVAHEWNRTTSVRFVDHYAARLALVQGDLNIAVRWADASGLDVDDADLLYDREDEYLSLARVRIAQKRADEALRLLNRLLQFAEAGGRMGSVIEILILQALALQIQKNDTEAIAALERALALAEPEGSVRIFVDEAEPLRSLLLDYQSRIKKKFSNTIDSESLRLLTYIDKLLASFSPPAPVKKPKHETLLEPLSERELDILRLIATGRSNQEIAEILVIALSTVKSHINNLYRKLGTDRRTQAIAIARNLGLLSE